jgi:O-acetylserine/cysteine efflux transporter
MPLRHLALALAVVAIWGTNFTIVRLALVDFPPLLFATVRFTLVFLPAALFVPRPALPWRTIASYGAVLFAGQFGLMFYAMGGLISPGVASLVIQSQVFFTILLSVVLRGERLRRSQLAALLLACAGIVLLVVHADGGTTPSGVAMVVLAGLCWASGNHIARSIGRVDVLALTVWAALFAIPLLAVATLLVDGPTTIARALATAAPGAWAAVLWQAIGNTMFGYGVWAWLLSRHSAATVAPLALLVPVFGMGTAAIVLHEPLPAGKLIAAGLVLSGLIVNVAAARRSARRADADLTEAKMSVRSASDATEGRHAKP